MEDRGKALEPFVLLAKGASGRGAAELVMQATAAPGVYVFGELLDCPSIAELEGNPELHPAHALLKLFAYGSLPEYRAAQASLPALTPAHLTKLKQLTVVELASGQGVQVLAYDELLQSLEIGSLRDLEDFLINECITTGVVSGKLDQKHRCLALRGCMGRDVKPGQVEDMLAALQGWLGNTQEVMRSIEQKVAWARREGEAAAARKEGLERKVEEVTRGIKQEMELRQSAQDFDGAEGGYPAAMDFAGAAEERAGRPKRRR